MDWKWLLFSFNGRINRKPFWLFNLALFALFVIVTLIVDGTFSFKATTLSKNITLLLVLWPALAITVKRWHDRNKSGWWLLINFVPIIGGLWALYETGLLEGTQGENRFGKDPLEGVEKRFTLIRQLTKKEIIWAGGAFILLLLALFAYLLTLMFTNANVSNY